MSFSIKKQGEVVVVDVEGQLIVGNRQELKLSRTKCSLNVPVALTEALANAILRGNESTGGKQVRVRAIISDEDLVFEIVDEGPGFDLDECTVDCTTEENLTREEGRGLFLMRQLMDRVESFRNQGNVVRLTLRRG